MAVTGPIRSSREECEREFAFLAEEYGCRFRGRFVGTSGYELYWWNDTTGVLVSFELRDPLFVYLCRLPDGPFPPRADEFTARHRIDWVFLLSLVPDDDVPRYPPEVEYSIPYGEVITDYVRLLRLYGDPVLRGDLRSLSERP